MNELLFTDIKISFLRVLSTLSISMLLGIIFGYFLYINQIALHKNDKKSQNHLFPIIIKVFSNMLINFVNSACRFLKNISPFAWLPLIIMLSGIGETAVFYTLLISMSTSAMLLCKNTYDKTNKDILAEAKCAGSNGFKHFVLIILPLSTPGLIGCFRILWSIGWQTLIAAEMLGVSSGLGYRLLDFRFLYKYKEMLLYIAIIGVIGWIFDLILEYIELRVYNKYF
ncbi:MAG: ABC transporter permease subunit [Candidatus Cloacimonetes bacterium]|nr:ABC transporter permease subunit [Candidatus Cloacimonadota bacterium]MDD4155083.1 ABC transporter permease subunit [Candidatus Cloacimonadota bacterium]